MLTGSSPLHGRHGSPLPSAIPRACLSTGSSPFGWRVRFVPHLHRQPHRTRRAVAKARKLLVTEWHLCDTCVVHSQPCERSEENMKILDVPQSGSLAGQTSSRNRYGQYRRTRAQPVNPGTITQENARAFLAQVSASWKQLTNTQRNGWEECAREYPIIDSLGQSTVLTGSAMFVRANTARLRASLPIIPDNVAATPWSSPFFSATMTNGASPTFIITAAAVPPGGQMLTFDAGPQVSAGVNYWSDFRRIGLIPGGTGPITLTLIPAYTNKFGPLQSGRKIFLRSRVLNECGVFGSAVIVTQIVPPPTGTTAATQLPAGGAARRGKVPGRSSRSQEPTEALQGPEIEQPENGDEQA